jgi:hypothetical protein
MQTLEALACSILGSFATTLHPLQNMKLVEQQELAFDHTGLRRLRCLFHHKMPHGDRQRDVVITKPVQIVLKICTLPIKNQRISIASI